MSHNYRVVNSIYTHKLPVNNVCFCHCSQMAFHTFLVVCDGGFVVACDLFVFLSLLFIGKGRRERKGEEREGGRGGTEGEGGRRMEAGGQFGWVVVVKMCLLLICYGFQNDVLYTSY